MNLRWIYFPFGLFAFYLIFGEGLRAGMFTASGEVVADLWQALGHIVARAVQLVNLAIWG